MNSSRFLLHYYFISLIYFICNLNANEVFYLIFKTLKNIFQLLLSIPSSQLNLIMLNNIHLLQLKFILLFLLYIQKVIQFRFFSLIILYFLSMTIQCIFHFCFLKQMILNLFTSFAVTIFHFNVPIYFLFNKEIKLLLLARFLVPGQ